MVHSYQKPSITNFNRNLRAKLYKESYEFVRQQRIQCLLQGAWFVNAIPMTSPAIKDPGRRPSRPWRFMRLDNGAKYLHYVDSAVKFPVRNGLEDLPERIDISLITEITTGTCAPPPNVLREYMDVPSSSLQASPLSFSLIGPEGSLADQIAPDQSRWADWTDGLNMLRRDGGHVASEETAGFVQALTEIGLKIKLLGECFSSSISSMFLILRHFFRSLRRKGRDPEWTTSWTPAPNKRLFLL